MDEGVLSHPQAYGRPVGVGNSSCVSQRRRGASEEWLPAAQRHHLAEAQSSAQPWAPHLYPRDRDADLGEQGSEGVSQQVHVQLRRYARGERGQADADGLAVSHAVEGRKTFRETPDAKACRAHRALSARKHQRRGPGARSVRRLREHRRRRSGNVPPVHRRRD